MATFMESYLNYSPAVAADNFVDYSNARLERRGHEGPRTGVACGPCIIPRRIIKWNYLRNVESARV